MGLTHPRGWYTLRTPPLSGLRTLSRRNRRLRLRLELDVNPCLAPGLFIVEVDNVVVFVSVRGGGRAVGNIASERARKNN